MSQNNEAELIRLLEKTVMLVARQQRAMGELTAQFVAMSTAITPVVQACPDPEVLTQFREEMEAINRSVGAILQDAEQLQ